MAAEHDSSSHIHALWVIPMAAKYNDSTYTDEYWTMDIQHPIVTQWYCINIYYTETYEWSDLSVSQRIKVTLKLKTVIYHIYNRV